MNPNSKGGHISPDELRSRLAHGEPLQILDVREFPEYAAGHLAGACLVPSGTLEARAATLERDVPVVCVCHSGKRSAQAAEKLAVRGFSEVFELEGGILAWKQAGLPLVKEPRAPWSLERQVRFALGFLVLTSLALSLRWPVTILIAWLISTAMVFTSIIDWCGLALLLAKAPWNRQNGGSCSI